MTVRLDTSLPFEPIYVIQTGQYDFYTPALLVCPRTSNAYNGSSGLVSASGSNRVEAVAKLRVQFRVDNLHELLRDLKRTTGRERHLNRGRAGGVHSRTWLENRWIVRLKEVARFGDKYAVVRWCPKKLYRKVSPVLKTQ